jgi:Na+-transporting methylmalonyl-CoA/oxaloacetate decarboxylase beta subunit
MEKDLFSLISQEIGLLHLTFGHILMWLIAGSLIYLAIKKKYEPYLLLPIGFGITVEPTGAFYVFANARHISQDSYRLAFDILEKAHVGVAPGIDFGPNGEGYLRFSYANSLDNIKEGMDRLEKYLKNLQ